MPSGGHPRSGPPPDPSSFRSAAAGSSGVLTPMTTPPKTPPAWPSGAPTSDEAVAWADIWARPAASLWERFGLVHDAAVHVRTLLAFAAGGYTNAALGGLVARQADNLGLTVAGAARNRWSWPAETTGNRATLVPLHGRQRPSARDRFRNSYTSPPAPDAYTDHEETDPA